MSGPIYAYRPSKAVTRQLVVTALEKLNAVASPVEYHYVGLGGLEFIDFELIHRRLGITAMTSIEKDSNHLARYEANRPYNGINILAGQAVDQLSNVKWSKLNAVWLDYECSLNLTEVLPSVKYLAGKLSAGDFLAVTLNAEPGPLQSRFDEFEALVGSTLVPANTSAETLGEWGKAAAQQQILFNVLSSELRKRGGNHSWRQILNIQYRDVARMQIVAGIIETPALARTLAHCEFEELPFYRPGEQAFVVDVPHLTEKERRSLNQQLPRKRRQLVHPAGVPIDEVEAYESLYRWLEPLRA